MPRYRHIRRASGVSPADGRAAESGRTPNDSAREYEPSAGSIGNWVAQHERDGGQRSDGLSTEERLELPRLRRENKQLRVERDILKRAAAWFARESDTIPGRDSGSGRRIRRVAVRTLCGALELSPSGYYAWIRRGPSARARRDAQLLERIKAIWRANQEVYRRAAHQRRVAGGRRADRREAGRAAHAARRDRRGEPQEIDEDRRAGSTSRSTGAGSGRSELQRRWRRSAVGGRQ